MSETRVLCSSTTNRISHFPSRIRRVGLMYSPLHLKSDSCSSAISTFLRLCGAEHLVMSASVGCILSQRANHLRWQSHTNLLSDIRLVKTRQQNSCLRTFPFWVDLSRYFSSKPIDCTHATLNLVIDSKMSEGNVVRLFLLIVLKKWTSASDQGHDKLE